MRSVLCVMVVAVYLVVCECTASEGTEGVNKEKVQSSEGTGEAVITTTTTTAVQPLPIQAHQPSNTAERYQKEVKPEKGEITKKKDLQEHDDAPVEHLPDGAEEDGGQATLDDKAKVTQKSGENAEREDASVNVAASPAATQTTTTTANANSVPLPDALQAKAKPTTTSEVTSVDHTNTVNKGDQITQGVAKAHVSHDDREQNTGDPKRPEGRDGSTDLSDVKGPSTAEVKTNIATAAVEKPSVPKGDNGKEKFNGQTKEENPDLEVNDARTEGQTTTPAVAKTGGKSIQSTPTSVGVTGGKKEQKHSPVSTQTTEVIQKKEDHAAITPGENSGERETIQKQKQQSTTTTTAEQITSTVAPTTTLPKGFKIPQSLDKTDGSRSTSILIAFATVVTFTVATAAPVY